MPDIDALLEATGTGRRSSRELQEALGVSQATISRLLAAAGERVVRFGARRSARYAAARRLFGSSHALPLIGMDAEGNRQELATLRGFGARQFVVEGKELPAWLRGVDGDGVYDDLPYFLDDLRPAGFLGRLFARTMGAAMGLPADARDWSADQLGRCLLAAGEAFPGALLLGDGAVARARMWTAERVLSPEKEYPLLAERTMAGEAPGSSAAGEQPKFTAWREDRGHVLVKFSPTGRNPEAARWRELLYAEYHALSALRKHGFDAAEPRVVEGGGRVFLELRRFDRVGAFGRRPMLSLAAVDAEFAGSGSDWTCTAEILRTGGLIDTETAARIAALQRFGEQIGNSDMHLGNLSLAPEGDGFLLLPVYDMLPMALAPRHGELPAALPARPPTDGLPHAVTAALRDYHRRLRSDERVSRGFRKITGV
jgi:hypothetical protein